MEHTRFVSSAAGAPEEEAARRNHYEGEAVTASFWSSAAASLPPHVRPRYAHLFEAAERWEPIIGFLVDACSSASRALAGLFRGRQATRGSERRRNFRAIGRA
jgi:hypothetical protein